MSASCSSRVRFEVTTTSGRAARLDRAELGDRDLEVGEELEQERLELVVGAVDLVDRAARPGPSCSSASSSGRRSRNSAPNSSPGSCPSSAGAQREQLARVVPVVERVVEVDPLVALQADQARARGRGERLGHLRLPDARLALEQQRLLERRRRGTPSVASAAVGEVVLLAERGRDLVDRRPGGSEAPLRGLPPPSARASVEHAREVPLVVGGGVQVGRRARCPRRPARPPPRSRRPSSDWPAQRLLRPRSPAAASTPCGSARRGRPDTVPPSAFDERAHADHRPVLGAPGELLVAEAPAVDAGTSTAVITSSARATW